jgi:hypothetical protein
MAGTFARRHAMLLHFPATPGVCRGDWAFSTNYVGFEIDHATLQHPRAAIFIDVNWEMHEYWRPNGKTLPLVGTPAMCLLEGLEELVAGSPKFGEVKKITQLRAT